MLYQLELIHGFPEQQLAAQMHVMRTDGTENDALVIKTVKVLANVVVLDCEGSGGKTMEILASSGSIFFCFSPQSEAIRIHAQPSAMMLYAMH